MVIIQNWLFQDSTTQKLGRKEIREQNTIKHTHKDNLHGRWLVVSEPTTVVQINIRGVLTRRGGVVILVFTVLLVILQESLYHTVLVGLQGT